MLHPTRYCRLLCAFTTRPSLKTSFYEYQNDYRINTYWFGTLESCGWRRTRWGNSVVCCNDPVFKHRRWHSHSTQLMPAEIDPGIQSPNLPPQPTILRPEISPTTPQTEFETPTTAQEKCRDPNGVEGICKSITECSAVLSNAIKNSRNSVYKQYIQQSNGICQNIGHFICCPLHNDESADRRETVQSTKTPTP